MISANSMLVKVLLIFPLFFSCYAFYLPGLAPVTYCKKSEAIVKESCQYEIPVYVNRLNTEERVMPYEYHYFDFCKVSQEMSLSPVENLGQVLFGERIRPSPYNITFLEDQSCTKLCEKKYIPTDESSDSKISILKRGMDNLPVTWCYMVSSKEQYCSRGFPMGCYMSGVESYDEMCRSIVGNAYAKPHTYYLFNHVDLTIVYHSGENEEWGSTFQDNGGRIIAIKVKPRSIKHPKSNSPDCKIQEPLSFPNEKITSNVEIVYSYSVSFERNDTIKWSSRWDYILQMSPRSNIQWFSILNSLMIVFFLSGMVGMIILRTLHKDIARYNQNDNGEDASEEFGWKLVHGDVFRPPRKGMLLSVVLGSGVQVLCMTVITLVFACLGFLSPANRGSLMSCALVLYVFSGCPAGYVSARIYKTFGGERWKSNILLTASICPGVVFLIFLCLNIILWSNDSSAAVPFTTLIALISLWSCISLPLTFVGAVFGFRQRAIEHPLRTNQIPRQIPEQSFYTQLVPGVIMGGVLPFGCIFIQLYFILNSIWSNQTYYMFGFLFLVFIILIITCSETTILLCYFHLCAEDYNWWWRSFLTSGFTAVYLFAYCVHFYRSKLNIEDAASFFLYFGYTFIAVFLFFLMTGCLGFFACFWFIRKIYSVVKVD